MHKSNQIKNVLLCRSHPHKTFDRVSTLGRTVLLRSVLFACLDTFVASAPGAGAGKLTITCMVSLDLATGVSRCAYLPPEYLAQSSAYPAAMMAATMSSPSAKQIPTQRSCVRSPLRSQVTCFPLRKFITQRRESCPALVPSSGASTPFNRTGLPFTTIVSASRTCTSANAALVQIQGKVPPGAVLPQQLFS